MLTMKLQAALSIINQTSKSHKRYLVSFEWVENNILKSDYFPDILNGEEAFDTEADAWSIAYKFTSAMGDKIANVYVTTDRFIPVDTYRERMLNKR